MVFFFFFFNLLFIQRGREREREAEGEAGSMPGADVELDLGTPGSRPGPKAGAKPLSHPGIPSHLHSETGALTLNSHENVYISSHQAS